MNYPKISIVTPSFNQGKYIEQTILSVLEQNYPNLEYIIIDGGSTDETVDIIKKYADGIAYWVSEKDEGQTDAINKGFAKCTGELFNWINSDDYYEPGTFELLAQLYTDNPQVNVFCGKEWGFNDLDPKEKIFHQGSVIGKDVFETIRTGIIDQPCTFWKKNSIDKLFPLDKSLRYVMDRQLWWAYLLQYGQENIIKVKEVFTHFRLHPASKSVSEESHFDNDFDRLKRSLFEQLEAPEILKQQLVPGVSAVSVHWRVHIRPADHILAAFAFYYAGRAYVKENMPVVKALMRWVKKWKKGKLSKPEFRLWALSCIIPWPLLKMLKKIK